MINPITWHRWVRIANVEKYLRLGWMPLPTLEGTPHGKYSVHMVWLCECKRREPI